MIQKKGLEGGRVRLSILQVPMFLNVCCMSKHADILVVGVGWVGFWGWFAPSPLTKQMFHDDKTNSNSLATIILYIYRSKPCNSRKKAPTS